MSLGRVKIGAALVLCAPFIPMIFEGEEFAASTRFPYFSNHQDPDVARAVSEGRRNEFAAFGWDPEDVPDPQDPSTFARSKLDWAESEQGRHAEILEWYRQLIELRRTESDLTDGRLDRVAVRFDEEQQWIAIQRGVIHLICNVTSAARRVPLRGRIEPLLASAPGWEQTPDSLELPGESVVIARELFA